MISEERFPTLSIEELSISFGKGKEMREVVSEVSFHVSPGKTLGIVGESGSGKTLTSLAVMGLLPTGATLSQGKAFFRDKEGRVHDLVSIPDNELRRFRGKDIAMIFQEPMSSLNPVMRCGVQVTESLQLHLGMNRKRAKEKTLELFGEVRLPRPESIYSSYPHQLSGGQKQRVMIAMAMACDPSLLIADEPTTALDVSVQKSILEMMKQLVNQHGTSLIFITHDLGVIRQIADDVLVMHQGKIVEQGPVEGVFNQPEHPYTKGLMACRPEIGQRPQRLLTVKDFLEKSETSPRTIKLESSKERTERHKAIYSQEPLLEVESLSTRFPDKTDWLGRAQEYVHAVDKVSFKLFPGETLGLVGESGSGKTTLGRTILRLIMEHEGIIRYKGEEITRQGGDGLRKLRREMQIIFQDPFSSLNPRLSAGEAILEPMIVHKLVSGRKQAKARVMELLLKVGLSEDHYNRYPHEFSGGQRQRIGIARALALQPSFIVCDESVSALDVSVQAQVLNLLNELKTEFGLTYIFISHDLSVVRYMSDRILVLRNGKLIEEGEADQLVKHPEHSYTQNLIESIPDFVKSNNSLTFRQ